MTKLYVPEASPLGVQVYEVSEIPPGAGSVSRNAPYFSALASWYVLTDDGQNGLQVGGRASLHGEGDGADGIVPRELERHTFRDVEDRVCEFRPGGNDGREDGENSGDGEAHGDLIGSGY